MRTTLVLTTAFLLLSLADTDAAAQARPMAVYLNDVKLEGGELKGVNLTNVDVRFSETGDVYIIAKGYKITAEPDRAAPPPPPSKAPKVAASAKQFYIVPGPQTRQGAAQWEIEVFVNQVFVAKFRSKDPEPMVEITKQMKAGLNTIHFKAKKEAGDRISSSPTDVFELVVGDGQLSQGQLMLNRLGSYKRTAAETGTYQTDLTIELQ